MNFFIKFISTFILALVLQLFFPWWTIAIAAFLIAAFTKGSNSFVDSFAGFLSLFMLWIGYSFAIDYQTQSILSVKIAYILPFQGNVILLIITTGLFAGIIGGFSALSGNLLFRWLVGKQRSITP